MQSKISMPELMGVLNFTPDSFYEESRVNFEDDILWDKYLNADCIDVGFESSRPGSRPVSEVEEFRRLDNFLKINLKFNFNLSIDTYKPSIAKYALENGFNIINDITGGGKSNKMFEVAADNECKIIIMHMKGLPANMQDDPYYDNVMNDLNLFFEDKIKTAHKIGVKDSQIILDPGLGFGKRIIDNYTIINNIECIKKNGYPVLIGISRKSFLSINNDDPKDRMPASLGGNVLALINGADIIRTHDVNEHYKMFKILTRILNSKKIKEFDNYEF